MSVESMSFGSDIIITASLLFISLPAKKSSEILKSLNLSKEADKLFERWNTLKRGGGGKDPAIISEKDYENWRWQTFEFISTLLISLSAKWGKESNSLSHLLQPPFCVIVFYKAPIQISLSSVLTKTHETLAESQWYQVVCRGGLWGEIFIEDFVQPAAQKFNTAVVIDNWSKVPEQSIYRRVVCNWGEVSWCERS